MTRWISSSRPITGSSLPVRASAVRITGELCQRLAALAVLLGGTGSRVRLSPLWAALGAAVSFFISAV